MNRETTRDKGGESQSDSKTRQKTNDNTKKRTPTRRQAHEDTTTFRHQKQTRHPQNSDKHTHTRTTHKTPLEDTRQSNNNNNNNKCTHRSSITIFSNASRLVTCGLPSSSSPPYVQWYGADRQYMCSSTSFRSLFRRAKISASPS